MINLKRIFLYFLMALFFAFLFKELLKSSHIKHYVKYEDLRLITFGEKLFFDKRLSAKNDISCASCHQPDKFFTDGLRLAKNGFSGKQVKRHTPSLLNLKNNNFFFYDGGIESLESTVLGPIQNLNEMGQDLVELEQELNKIEEYKLLTKTIFQDDSIRSPHLMKAIAAYLRTLNSKNSTYDAYKNGTGNLGSEEKKGLQVFEKNCKSCHSGDNFSDNRFHKLELSETEDLGRYIITLDSNDLYKFKTPSLRNVSQTAPYMHNGEINNLNEAIPVHGEHISKKLKPVEIQQVIRFLKTLTDKK